MMDLSPGARPTLGYAQPTGCGGAEQPRLRPLGRPGGRLA